MHYTSSIARIIFDPEVYMSILTEIVRISKVKSIDMYTIFLLNSIYANEMLDEDLKWKDRSGDEFKEFVNKRVRMIIQVGVDLVKSSQQVNQSVKFMAPTKSDEGVKSENRECNNSKYIFNNFIDSSNKFSNTVSNLNTSSTTFVGLDGTVKDNNEFDSIGFGIDNTNQSSSLSDLVDSMPIDHEDEYYKKVNKLKSDSSESKNSVIFK